VTIAVSPLDAYVHALDPPHLEEARRLASASLDEGMDVEGLIEDVLAPAQREVGRRWYANEWTVADEHAASAITDAVLAEASLRTASPSTAEGRLVSCGVEGEWHTLPVRMLTDQLVANGHDVTFLGPSLSSAQLIRSLREITPVAVLASCTVPLHLAGARRTIEAAHQAGVPVIIGGLALGADGSRAAALGADAWAPSAQHATDVLATWARQAPRLQAAQAVKPEQALLELPADLLVSACLQTMLDDNTLGSLTEPQLERAREDITFILQFCSAALIVDEPGVFDEFTRWLRGLLAVRGVPAAAIRASYQALAKTLGAGFPATVAMLAAAMPLL
jgi:methanogenic corrinoid protein MtbC1